MNPVRIIVPLYGQRIVCPVPTDTVAMFSRAGLERALKAFAIDHIAPERARYGLLLETFDSYLKEMGLPGPQAMYRRRVAPALPEVETAMVWHRMLAPAVLEGSAVFNATSEDGDFHRFANRYPIQFELGPEPVPIQIPAPAEAIPGLEPIPADANPENAPTQRYLLPYRQGRFFISGPNGKLAEPRILAGEWIDAIR